MNNLSAIGNVSKDAELRHTANGDAVCQFNFALNSGYGDKQITTWLNCSLWGKRATTLAPMLLKGTKIGITGELTNRPYTAKDGTEKYSLEVRIVDLTLLGSKKDAETRADAKAEQPSNGFDDLESDIPFNHVAR